MHVQITEKRYEAHTQVLKEIDFCINDNEFISIIGPSGAGKSTLLKILAGLDTQYSGHVTQRPERITYVFQEPRLLPWLRVIENLTITQTTPDIKACARILQQVGLEEVQHYFPGQLSGGMQRRVALARALLHQPDLLLLDEPFVSLDAPTAQHLRLLLSQLVSSQSVRVVLVTHDLSEALELSTRIIALSHTPATILQDIGLPEHTQPRGADQVALLKQQLMARHPTLLHGVAP